MRPHVLEVTDEVPWIRRVTVVVSLAILTVIGAKVHAPLTFLPITLQTAAVVFAGLWAGSRLGAAAQISYLIMGLSGLPVFAMPGAGPAYFAGPTAGYLLAFPLGAWLAGHGTQGRFVERLAWSVAGVWSIVLCGGAWLALSTGIGQFSAGVLPFLLPEALKALLIAAGVSALPARWQRSE